MGNEPLSLSNIYQGGAIEAFDHELKAVLENIDDINTNPDAERSVTLVMKIKPDKDRDVGKVKIEVKSKLAPAQALETKLYMEKGTAQEMFKGQNPNQHVLPGSTAVGGNVVNLNDRKTAAAGGE